MAYPNAGGGYGPYNFLSGPSTLDPGSMAALTYFLGGSNSPFGQTPQQQINGYNQFYNQQYGQQAPGGPNAYAYPTTPFPDAKPPEEVYSPQRPEGGFIGGGSEGLVPRKDAGGPDNGSTNPKPNGGGGGGTTAPAPVVSSTLWRGGQRNEPWSPTPFLQAGSMFGNLNEQVQQGLMNGVQAQGTRPAWTQNVLPPRLNYQQNMASYYPTLQGPGQPRGSRTMSNPYPLNGTVPIWASMSTGNVTNGSNPFIGSRRGYPDAQQKTSPLMGLLGLLGSMK